MYVVTLTLKLYEIKYQQKRQIRYVKLWEKDGIPTVLTSICTYVIAGHHRYKNICIKDVHPQSTYV